MQVVSLSLWLLLFPRHGALEIKHSAAGWQCPTPRALHARPGCCCRLHPAGPALALAPRAESSKPPLPRQSWPGFCRGCRAPPRPGWGRKSGVRGGTGALQERSDPILGWKLPHHTTAGLGQRCQEAPTKIQINLGGQTHGFTRLSQLLVCKGL